MLLLKKNIYRISVMAFCILILSSCMTMQPIQPNILHAPFVGEKGELEGILSYGHISGLDAGICYAVTDNLAIMGNLQWNDRKNISGDTKIGSFLQNVDYKMLEIAPGYFLNSKNSRFSRFEIFGGLGYGKSNRFFTAEFIPNFIPLTYKGDFYRAFIQTNIGHVTKNFEFGISGRFANVYFPVLDISGLATHNYAYPARIDNFNRFFFETAANMSVGFKYVKFNTQAGISSTSTTEYLSGTKPFLRLGLQYRFYLLKEKI